MIAARELSRIYGWGQSRVEALRGVNLHVAQGEFVAVKGQSGSGKTTLLNLIGGLDRPTAGTVTVNGLELTRASDAQLSRFRNQTVGFVFQTYYLHPLLSVVENVAAPLWFAGVGRRERRRLALARLEALGLGQRAHHKAFKLSAGEKQRTVIARALVTRPRLLLADEPTANLDAANTQAVVELLRRICREEGVTVLLMSHDAAALSTADRVLTLSQGVLTEGRP